MTSSKEPWIIIRSSLGMARLAIREDRIKTMRLSHVEEMSLPRFVSEYYSLALCIWVDFQRINQSRTSKIHCFVSTLRSEIFKTVTVRWSIRSNSEPLSADIIPCGLGRIVPSVIWNVQHPVQKGSSRLVTKQTEPLSHWMMMTDTDFSEARLAGGWLYFLFSFVTYNATCHSGNPVSA